MRPFLHKLKAHNKQLGVLFIVLFSISLLFPIVAAVFNTRNEVSLTAGILDVAIAFFCFLLYVLLTAVNGKPTEPVILMKIQKLTEYLVAAPLVLISLFFLSIQVNWVVLLIGLGWRWWLLIMALPYLVSLFHKK